MKIVFLLLDALRYDIFKEHMPLLNKFAHDSMNYTKCLSGGPNTAISVTRLLSNQNEWDENSLKDNLIQDLNKKGLHTQIVFSTPRMYKFQEIFNESIDIFNQETSPMLGKLREKYHETLPFKAFRKYIVGLGYRRAETLTDYSIEALDQAPNHSFSWIHYMDPHIPWIPPNLSKIREREAQLLEKKMRNSNWTTNGFNQIEIEKCRELYIDECKYLDIEVDRLIKNIEADLVIVTSDHGDLIGEYGRFSHPNLYVPELLHVPLIIHGHGKGTINRWMSHYKLRRILNAYAII